MSQRSPTRWLARTWLAAAALTVAAACYPDQPTSVGGQPTVTTLRAPDASFAAPTFTLIDSIVQIVEEGQAEAPISRQYDDLVLNELREQMIARGYRELTFPFTTAERPDFVMVAGAASEVYVGYFYDYYAYWGWWGGWAYPPGWGWYYPGYVVPYAFEHGSLLVSLIDRRAAAQQPDKVPVVWVAGISAVLTGGNESARIVEGIDQAFAQSPYLNASGSPQ